MKRSKILINLLVIFNFLYDDFKKKNENMIDDYQIIEEEFIKSIQSFK